MYTKKKKKTHTHTHTNTHMRARAHDMKTKSGLRKARQERDVVDSSSPSLLTRLEYGERASDEI